MSKLLESATSEHLSSEADIDVELKAILSHPEIAVASFEAATVDDTDLNDLQVQKVEELREHRHNLLEEVSGMQGQALEKLMSDPVASFRSVVEGLSDLYRHRSIYRSHGEQNSQHFATRNEKRDDVDLHFAVTSDKHGNQLYMSLQTDLQGQLEHPCLIRSGPKGEFDIVELREAYDKKERFWTTKEVPMSPADELVILSAVFADTEYAVHAYDPKNDHQARGLLKRALDRRP